MVGTDVLVGRATQRAATLYAGNRTPTNVPYLNVALGRLKPPAEQEVVPVRLAIMPWRRVAAATAR